MKPFNTQRVFNSLKEYEKTVADVAGKCQADVSGGNVELHMYRHMSGAKVSIHIPNDDDGALRKEFYKAKTVEQLVALGAEIDTEPRPAMGGG